MNSRLNDEQVSDAERTLDVNEIVYVPQELLNIWGDIPPELSSYELMQYIKPIKNWLLENVKNHDALLIQGEPISVYYIVYWMAQKDIKSYVATTRRVVVEEQLPDGSIVKKSTFRHVRFRRYIT
jgi:hypothetical protein